MRFIAFYAAEVMKRYLPIITASLAVTMAVGVVLAGGRGGGGRGGFGGNIGAPGRYSGMGDAGDGERTSLGRDGPTHMPDEHRNGIPVWEGDPHFKSDAFTFVRIR